jgi:hypothetical protein
MSERSRRARDLEMLGSTLGCIVLHGVGLGRASGVGIMDGPAEKDCGSESSALAVAGGRTATGGRTAAGVGTAKLAGAAGNDVRTGSTGCSTTMAAVESVGAGSAPGTTLERR